MIDGSILYNRGINYYDYGRLTPKENKRQITGYYYKLTKPLTDEQLQDIKKDYPHAYTLTSQPLYAPEIIRQVLVFPSKAEIKRLSQ
jgi:hypothetical protein